MKKTILYAIAAAAAATAAIIIIGCNGGAGGDSAGLNNFLGNFVNRDPGSHDGKYTVNVENGGSPGGGSYAAGETVVITTDGERDGLRFNGWTSSSAGVNIAEPGNTQTYFIMPPNAVTVTANFAPKTKFAVEYDANGGENPPRDNGSPYDSGMTVAALDKGDMSRGGHYFSGWSTERDGGRQIGGGETFTITGPTTLYARWTPNAVTSYEVIVNNGSGGGKRTAGETVTVTAGNVDGQTFKNWTSTPQVAFADANAPTTTFQMPASNVTATANFEAQTITPSTYTLTVKAGSGGTATPASQSVAAGTQVNISATPASGYSFSNWTISGGGTIVNANSASTTVTVINGDVTVTANFTQNSTTTYTLSIGRTVGGTTSPANNQTGITAGTQVNISATPTTGYTFVNWTISGGGTIANANSASTTVTVNGNVSVTANFIMITYTLTVNRNPANGGTAEANSYSNITPGSQVNISASPATGYKFDYWTVIGSGRFANSNMASTTVQVNGDITVTANFSENGTAGYTSCNQYCNWGLAGCGEIVIDSSGLYYVSEGDKNLTPHPINSCQEATAYCDLYGGGRYNNNNCTGAPVVSDPNEWCGVYCIWGDGNCSEILTDKRDERNGAWTGMGIVRRVCRSPLPSWAGSNEGAENGCEMGSRAGKVFRTLAECKASEYFGVPALSKSRSASPLRATYSQGAVTATLSTSAPPAPSVGVAELIDEKTGSVVSTVPVKLSGRSAVAVLPAGMGVPAGYYTVRVVLTDRVGGRTVAEASIGIIK